MQDSGVKEVWRDDPEEDRSINLCRSWRTLFELKNDRECHLRNNCFKLTRSWHDSIQILIRKAIRREPQGPEMDEAKPNSRFVSI